MNEKTKKIIVIVFTAIASLIASISAVCLGLPLEDLIPKDFAPIAPALDTNSTVCDTRTVAYISSVADEEGGNYVLTM